MNKRIPLLLLVVASLNACNKTNLLYDENAYNYPQFDRNYYTEWEGIDNLIINETTTKTFNNVFSTDDEKFSSFPGVEGYTWGGDKETQFGYNNNLSKAEKKFSYGMTSKLFDGRVRCEGLYQKSRIQLDKSGFAMYFPKQLISCGYLSFACRGGTNYDDYRIFQHAKLKVNFTWSFYLHMDDGSYNKVIYQLNNVNIPTDNNDGGNSAYVSLFESTQDYTDISKAVAMSLEWECVDPDFYAKEDLTDDYKDKNKHHLALMLYEVFIGYSLWN